MADEIVEMVPMDKCGVFTGKSIEDAKRKAADDFQIPLKDIKFKVIEDVKKGFFGKIKTEAKVWAGYNEPDDLGPDYMDVKRKELVEKTKMDACRNYLIKWELNMISLLLLLKPEFLPILTARDQVR